MEHKTLLLAITYRRIKHYFRYRFDPVPYTGKMTRYRNYWRYMKTTQEKRWNLADPEYIRGKRNNLPSAWDDYYRGDINNKSWKHNKKIRRQWMKNE